MRESSPIEPMWEAEGQDDPPSGPGSSLVRTAARMVGRVARTLNPPLHRWLIGKAPALHVSWGSSDYELRPDGVVVNRREGEGWRSNPTTNYNERFEKKKSAVRENTEAASSAEPNASDSDAREPARARKAKPRKAKPRKAKPRKASGKKSTKKSADASIPENGGGRPATGSS